MLIDIDLKPVKCQAFASNTFYRKYRGAIHGERGQSESCSMAEIISSENIENTWRKFMKN